MRISENTLRVLAKVVTGDSGVTPYRSGPMLVMLFNQFYDQRSQAAHTANGVEAEAAQETFMIMRHILMKMISDNSVPSREFLEKLLFGAT